MSCRYIHVVNPVAVPPSSDLFIAQPITFQTMKIAKNFAEQQGVSIRQLAVCYKEDRCVVPPWLEMAPTLEKSCLDMTSFRKERKLPFLADILRTATNYTEAEYIIYTNVDIALMPYFYVTVDSLINNGHDVITICRRTISKKYHNIQQIPEMYADFGDDHPGTDCFVIKRELVRKLQLSNVVIGAQFVAFALRVSLNLFAKKIIEIKLAHMTFHIGDDREWLRHDEYSYYNALELEKIFLTLNENASGIDREKLSRYEKEFEHRKGKWLTMVQK